MNKPLKFFTIGISLVVAMALMLVPLPDWAQPYRPEWIILALIYWSMALPRDIGVGIAWISGLCVDAIQGAILGQHALGFVVTVYIAIYLHARIRNYPLHQQALSVGMILLPYMAISLWIPGIVGENPKPWLYWASVITSALVWPCVFLGLRAIRRAASIQ